MGYGGLGDKYIVWCVVPWRSNSNWLCVVKAGSLWIMPHDVSELGAYISERGMSARTKREVTDKVKNVFLITNMINKNSLNNL